jgi:CubicO group peptidase (beta-lactamase class C family)
MERSMSRRILTAVALACAFLGMFGAAHAGAPTGLPEYAFELVEPPRPRGTILVIHGGGWLRVGADEVAAEGDETARLAGYGWRVLSVDYSPGVQAPASIREWYDAARRRWPGPICAFGRSAGAHLALLLARERPLACVIGHGAITDLRALGGTPEADELVRDFVIPSFGRRLGQYSPLTYAGDLGVPTSLATSAGDRLAPCDSQLEPFAQRGPTVRAACLPTGTAPFVHGNVDAAALALQHRRERAVLRRAGTRPRPATAGAPGPVAPGDARCIAELSKTAYAGATDSPLDSRHALRHLIPSPGGHVTASDPQRGIDRRRLLSRGGLAVAGVAAGAPLAAFRPGSASSSGTDLGTHSTRKRSQSHRIPQAARPGGSYDRYVADLAAKDQFSGVVLLTHRGRTVLSRSYGMADEDRGIRNGEDVAFVLSSASQPFLAGLAIAAQIVEAVSGTTYWDYVHKHVFRPAGMTRSSFYTRKQWLADRHIAHAYMRQRDGSRVDAVRHVDTDSLSMQGPGENPARGFIGYSAGNAFSTAADLTRFAQALYNGALLARPFVDVLTSAKLPGPEPRSFEGYTMPVSIVRGPQWLLGRGGGTGGAGANWNIYPDTGWVGVVLTNHDDVPLPDILQREVHAITGEPIRTGGGGG